MFDLNDLPLRPLAALIVGVCRALVWVWSEFIFDTLGWKIGWCVCRVLTFGKLPVADFSGEHETTMFVRIVVEVIGIGVLCAIAWGLSTLFWL